MCSVDEGDILLPEKKTGRSVDGRLCMKCKENPAVVIIRSDDPYCKDCFLAYCTHKFRSAFGKSRLIRDKEHVLVAYSGGAGSVAMLHLIQEGLSKRAHKKLRFQPSLVYIEEGAVLGDKSSFNSEILEKMQSTSVNCYCYRLEQALGIDTEDEASCGLELQSLSDFMANQKESKETEQLDALLQSATSLTAKENIVFQLRRKLLVHVARLLGCSKVLVGDSASRLAVRLISNITQGTGAHLHHEMSFADDRLKDVMIVRPMREFTCKEIATYNSMNKLCPVSQTTLSTKADQFASLDKLSETFVLGLQADFPNTVSTILRTGEKLTGATGANEESHRCPLCQAPVDTKVGLSSALNATEFSQSLCTVMLKRMSELNTEGNESCNHVTDHNCCNSDSSHRSGSDSRLSRNDLKSILCYGCRLVIKDMADVWTLPPYVLKNAASVRKRG